MALPARLMRGRLSLPQRHVRSISFSSTMSNGNMYTHRNGAVPQRRQNAWVGVAGPGSRDLRSDVMTVPTPAMLAAVQACTLGDDVFGEDPDTRDLEEHVARMAGKQAGLFVLSGTMGNQLALRSLLTQPPHSVLADHRSHIILYEAGGVSSLTGATVKPIIPKNNTLTLEDIKPHVVLGSDIHSSPTRVIVIENTLNGMITPLSEIRRISEYARAHNIRMHCDGARLWEAVAAGAGSLEEFCAQFDTVSMCFSKGLGAPVGSILVGDRDVVQHARWVRKSIGGGMRQPGMLAAAARVAVDETFTGGLLQATHVLAKEVEGVWTGMGGKLVHPVQTNHLWLDLEDCGCKPEEFVELGKGEGLALMGGRLVIHYQVAQNKEDVLPRLERVFAKVLKGVK